MSVGKISKNSLMITGRIKVSVFHFIVKKSTTQQNKNFGCSIYSILGNYCEHFISYWCIGLSVYPFLYQATSFSGYPSKTAAFVSPSLKKHSVFFIHIFSSDYFNVSIKYTSQNHETICGNSMDPININWHQPKRDFSF